MHRIPYGRRENPKFSRLTHRPAIYLQHALLCSSYEWVANGRNYSSAFLLADAGFDVWMGNFRGNTYSRKHSEFHPDIDASDFWDWSIDELVNYDLPAMFEKIRNETKQDSIYYIGHSLGTVVMFAKLSKDPDFSKYVKSFFALAPVTTLSNIRGAFSYIGRYFGKNYEDYVVKRGSDEFFGSTIYFKAFIKYTAGLFLPLQELYSDFIALFVGPAHSSFDMTRVPSYLSHTPAGTSSKVMEHFLQIYSYQSFSSFDMGFEKNMIIYGQPYAPNYEIENIQNVSIYIFWSNNDWLSTKADMENTLFPKLNRGIIKGVYEVFNYNHLDFMWNRNSVHDVFNPIIDIIYQKL